MTELKDLIWWNFEHEDLIYNDGPMEITWVDSKGQRRLARILAE